MADMWAKWDDIEKHVRDGVEAALMDEDMYESGLATRMANAVWRQCDYHMEGYYAEDVADEASHVPSSREQS